MAPRPFTNSTALHVVCEEFQQEQIIKFLYSMDPGRRGRLAEACPYIMQIRHKLKRRKRLGLLELCASMIEEGLATSTIVLPGSELRSSRIAANAVSVALGVLCLTGLLRTLGPSRASLWLAAKKVS